MCRDHVEDPAFAPYTSELAAGFWPFYNLLFAICPACTVIFNSFPFTFISNDNPIFLIFIYFLNFIYLF